ncbi:hypothetical protein [Geosporobacter ferrireducens]|nr:hypothetical protein [Geosporobacter ferrireducens]
MKEMNTMTKNVDESTYQYVVDILSREIMEMVETRNILASRALEYFEPEVHEIIESRCCDKQKIEELLDRLLDYCFNEQILLLYRKLCRYYYQIDPAATVGYVNAYRDMWDCE